MHSIHEGWKYVENDGSSQNLIFITGLKSIYAKQLPNMPKEYVCRLIYERRHKHTALGQCILSPTYILSPNHTVHTALVKKNGTVIGGDYYSAFSYIEVLPPLRVVPAQGSLIEHSLSSVWGRFVSVLSPPASKSRAMVPG